MSDLDNTLPNLGRLLEQRLAVVGQLAESMEASRLALTGNDAEAIARGAAHQAELCRQWSLLEGRLRLQAERLRKGNGPKKGEANGFDSGPESTARARSAELAAEWEKLSARIRYLKRLHSSLLRHMQRSLAVWNRLIASCEPMYAPARELVSTQVGLRASSGSVD